MVLILNLLLFAFAVAVLVGIRWLLKNGAEDTLSLVLLGSVVLVALGLFYDEWRRRKYGKGFLMEPTVIDLTGKPRGSRKRSEGIGSGDLP